MSALSRVKLRLWWERAAWVIPLFGVLCALFLYQGASLLDEEVYARETAPQFSNSAAITILAAIGGGMITFTGFVFSFVVLLLQFGSSAYSPRSVAYFLRARAVQWILALFLAMMAYWGVNAWRIIRDADAPSWAKHQAIWLLGAIGVYAPQLLFHELSYTPLDNSLVYFLAGTVSALVPQLAPQQQAQANRAATISNAAPQPQTLAAAQ